MTKMVYVGPGANKENPKTMEVTEAEVVPLEKGGLWKKASKKSSSSNVEKKDGE